MEKYSFLLTSDCFPSPSLDGYKNLFDEPSYKAVLKESETIQQQNCELLTLKPSAPENKNNWEVQLASKTVTLCSGTYFEIRPKYKYDLLGKETVKIEKTEIISFLSQVNQIRLKF